jgi:hypothetical protein
MQETQDIYLCFEGRSVFLIDALTLLRVFKKLLTHDYARKTRSISPTNYWKKNKSIKPLANLVAKLKYVLESFSSSATGSVGEGLAGLDFLVGLTQRDSTKLTLKACINVLIHNKKMCPGTPTFIIDEADLAFTHGDVNKRQAAKAVLELFTAYTRNQRNSRYFRELISF